MVLYETKPHIVEHMSWNHFITKPLAINGHIVKEFIRVPIGVFTGRKRTLLEPPIMNAHFHMKLNMPSQNRCSVSLMERDYRKL